MIPIIVGIIVVAIVGFFVGGRITGSNDRPPSTPVGSNDQNANCTEMCNQWDMRRQERCLAESAAQASQRKVDNLRVELAVAGGIAAALATAAYLASLVPPFGWIAALVLAAAAVAAFLAADFIVGELSVAEEEVAVAERNAAGARNAESDARRLLLSKCPEQAGACLLRPSPC